MKKYLTLLVILVAANSLFAQKIEIKDKMSFRKVEGMEAVSIGKLKSLRNDQVSVLKNLTSGELYKVKDFFFALNSASVPISENYLDEMDKEKRYLIEPASNYYSSEIRSYNGHRTLVINYELKETQIGIYGMFSVNKQRNKIIVGTLEYPLGQRSSAGKIVSGLVESFDFDAKN